jgi:probable rRNA maturation factor
MIVAVGYSLARRGVPAPGSFRRWVAAALHGAGQTDAIELAIQLVDADEGRAMNAQYRQRDYATNVLSFPAALLPGQPSESVRRHLGDLVICAAVVAREAAEQSKALHAHYAHLTVHGVLHLLGYDHVQPVAAEQMEALETAVLARLGFADPYIAD